MRNDCEPQVPINAYQGRPMDLPVLNHSPLVPLQKHFTRDLVQSLPQKALISHPADDKATPHSAGKSV